MDKAKRPIQRRERTWIFIFSVLLRSCGVIEGAVTLSPSGVAPVCNGGQLELTCTTAGRFLRWRFTVIRGNERITTTRTIQAAVPAGDAMSHLAIDSTMFNFSRTSSEGSSPVTSKLVIGPVTSNLNGTVMNCISSNLLSTTIIVREREPLRDPNVRERHIEFGKEGVTITLEWDEVNPLYSVDITVIPETQVNISNSTAQLSVTYNMTHNVSVVISHRCDQSSVTVYNEEYYYQRSTTSTSACENPKAQIADSVVVLGYADPAVEGTTVMFHCRPGFVLNGSKSSICMENGEWEPAPSKLNCSNIVMENASSPELGIILGCSLGVVLGLAIIIVAVALIAGFLIKARFKGSNTSFYKRTTQQESMDAGIELSPVPIEDDTNNHNVKVVDVQTSGLVYADIGQATFKHQRQLLPGIPDLDDSPLEYARINHKAHVEPTASQNTTKDIDIPRVNLDSLLIQLRPQITTKWYQFGEAAGIEKGILDSFAKSCSPDDRIIEMLDYWLRNSPIAPTWRDIAGVLKLINYLQLANDIEKVYVTGKLPVEVDMDWVPQTTEPEIEPPPPIPPKMNEMVLPQIATETGLNQPADTTVLTKQGNDLAPMLPPKPKCDQMMTGVVPPRPPRF